MEWFDLLFVELGHTITASYLELCKSWGAVYEFAFADVRTCTALFFQYSHRSASAKASLGGNLLAYCLYSLLPNSPSYPCLV